MIFVTVGTHEQQFNRLIKEIDRLKKENLIKDNVFIQTGYSDYIPKYCKYKKFLSYDEMQEFINNADIVITHGGPASFMKSLSNKKRTIIVPRLKKFDEHVNNHQLDFLKNINLKVDYLVEINDLYTFILGNHNYSSYKSNNYNFCLELNNIIEREF